MSLLRCALWICFPNIHYSFRFSPGTLRKFGMSFAAGGRASLARRRASRWVEGGSGRMRFGWARVQTEELNCKSRESDHIHWYKSGARVLRREFIIVFVKMAGSPVDRSSGRRSGA